MLSSCWLVGSGLCVTTVVGAQEVTGVQPELVALCVTPMRIFTLWPPAVALRSYCQGRALRERRTKALAAAGPLRVLAIATTLQLFSMADGAFAPERAAVAGTIALCAGFWTEALACFLMLRFDFRRCRRAEPAPVAAAPAQPEQSKEERTSLLRDEEDGDE